MKQHSTNYTNTFIETAPDCPVEAAQAPPLKEPKSLARREYEMLIDSPYQYTSDDVRFQTQGQPAGMRREAFFAQGRPCFRASALTQRYGWGVHADGDSKIALHAMESEAYGLLTKDPGLRHVQAMRRQRK